MCEGAIGKPLPLEPGSHCYRLCLSCSPICRPVEACCAEGSWALGLTALEGGPGPSGIRGTVTGQGAVCRHACVGSP